MADQTVERSRRDETRQLATLVLGFAMVAVVLVVPLLLDIGNLRNTYYFPKARALYILSPLIILALAVLGRTDRRLTDRGILIPAGLFMICTVAATVFGVNPVWSLLGAPWRSEGMLTLLAYPTVLVGTMVLVRLGYLRLWLLAVFGGATIVASYGVAQYFGYEWLVRDSTRLNWWAAFSTTGNMNFLGAYMLLVLPFALGAAAAGRARSTRAMSLVGAYLLFSAALFTHSRSVWGFIVLELAGFTLLFPRERAALFHRYILIGTALLITAAVFITPGGPLAPRSAPGFPSRGADPSALRRAGQWNVEDPTVQWRPQVWRLVLSLLGARPVFGYGPEALVLVFPQNAVQEASQRSLFPKTIDKAHNDTLDMAMSVGLLGLVMYWWLLLASLRRAWSAFRSHGLHRLIGLAAFVGILAFWSNLQFGFSIVSVAPVFWSVMGAAAGLAPAPLRGTKHATG